MAQHNTTSPSPPEEPASSYTKMDSNDLEAIGARCQFAYCHQLDFLPFRCESCKSSFCLDHRSETAHRCPRAGEWAKNRRQQNTNTSGGATSLPPSSSGGRMLSGLNPTECSQSECKTIVNTIQNTGSRCDNCNRQYCLKHRFREEHDCAKIAALGARQSSSSSAAATSKHLENQAEKFRVGLARLRTWGKGKQESLRSSTGNTTNTGSATTQRGSSSAAAARAPTLAALNTLKRTAKGDTSIPQNKRLYFYVEAQASDTSTTTTTTTTPKPPQSEPQTASLFFSSDWTVGRLLDEATRRMHVVNVNNRAGEKQRLRVYHVRGGRLLGFSEKLGDVSIGSPGSNSSGGGGGSASARTNNAIETTGGGGGRLVSGDTLVLLRGVDGLA